MELPIPLSLGFFPQMVLTVEELMYYRRLSRERVSQLARLIDDADCVYRWTDLKARNGQWIQKAQFVDLPPATTPGASQELSTILKCSIHMVDVQPEEILHAIAKVKTREARKTMSYLYGDEVIDTQTLLTFPTSSAHQKPCYAYRAIKWSLLKARRREGQKSLDFCYVEYAGKCTGQDKANRVVGFCLQDSITRDRQVPTLERFKILRGHMVRSGIVITKTHQSNILQVTAIAHIDGAMASTGVRLTMEEIMVDFVAAVHRVKGLLERQRMSRLRYLDEWDWIATKDRKACAVCLRVFFLHRKHHCATCGEVVCSNCAPLRELEEPLDQHRHSIRVCSVCMAQAGSRCDSGATGSENDMLEMSTFSTNVGTETYVGGLRYPKHREIRRESTEESLRGLLSQQTSVHSQILPFQQRHDILSSHSSAQGSGYAVRDANNAQYPPARWERRSSAIRHSTSSSSTMSAQAKKEALDKLVEHVRQIRKTINVAISEAEKEEERHSMLLESGGGDPDAGPERYDGIFDRIMKVRKTLDVSSLDFDAVLDSIGQNDPVCPSDANSDRLDSDLAFSFSEGTGSAIESVSDFRSSRSSLLSESLQSLDHQDAGEPLPSPTPEQGSAVEEARALEEAMQWVCQSKPTAIFRPPRPAPSVVFRSKVDDQTDPEPVAKSNASKTCGIERLAHKIGRLHQRLEATQGRSEATSSKPMSVVAGPVTPTPLDVSAVIDERDRNADDEPEPEKQPTQQSRGPVVTHLRKEKNVEIAVGTVPSSRLSEPSRAPSDLVASLRGVMNSSELTHAPSRRRPEISVVASPIEAPSNGLSLAWTPSRNSFPGTLRRARKPLPPAAPVLGSTPPSAMVTPAPRPTQSTKIYVFDPDDRLQKAQSQSLDYRPSKTIKARPDKVPDSNNEDDEQGHSGNSHCLSSSNEEQERARSSTGAAVLSPARARVRDESGELRELMKSLAKAPLRHRCLSGQSTGAPPTETFDL